ncbi:MAG: hypothetical protein M3P34_04040 [Actinomycetota bacterium]|nr:hypothetical protein [Actinomycetota bacterium]
MRGAVRADLDEVFRRDYELVVLVAARVLGSRDQAEDVAQEVFLSFGRSSVAAREARGWLSVTAAHTALNLLRSRRRRASREESDGQLAARRRHPCRRAMALRVAAVRENWPRHMALSELSHGQWHVCATPRECPPHRPPLSSRSAVRAVLHGGGRSWQSPQLSDAASTATRWSSALRRTSCRRGGRKGTRALPVSDVEPLLARHGPRTCNGSCKIRTAKVTEA